MQDVRSPLAEMQDVAALAGARSVHGRPARDARAVRGGKELSITVTKREKALFS